MKTDTVSKRKFVFWGIVVHVFLAACGCGTSQSFSNPPNGSNPAPAITSISPNTAPAGGAAFTLTIYGTNFVAASMVSFGGTALNSNFVSSTLLTTVIPTAAVISAGNPTVSVTNPAPGGGTSNGMNFAVTSSGPNPVPTISSLIPSCAPAGGQTFQLSVNGSNFVASSVVRWNGSDRPTTIGSSFSGPMLKAQIPASDIAASATAAVTVFNPAPGGGSSNTSTFNTAPGPSPRSIAIDPAGKFVYVANEGCPAEFPGNVSTFKVDLTTGILTSIGLSVAADFGPRSVTVDPSGKFVYVANDGGRDLNPGSVSIYTINGTTGALTSTGMIGASCAPPPSPGSCTPFSVAVHPSGKFAYVADEGGFTPTSVSMYSINATTGTLAYMGIVAAGGRAVSVTVDPSGKFAYVADGSTNSDGSPGVSVSIYSVNATTGALTSIGKVPAGTSPTSIAIDPSSKFAYVTNSSSNNVSMYTLNAATGSLTSMGLIAAGTKPSSVAVDPTGKFAYVANFASNDVSMYSIDTTSGALTGIGTIPAGSSPSSMAIVPSGKFAYVTNFGSNNVSMYSIDSATGALTLIGTVGT